MEDDKLAEIAREKGVTSYEVSKLIGIDFETEKAWVRMFDGEITVMTREEVRLEKELLDLTDGIGYSEIITQAYQVHEIIHFIDRISVNLYRIDSKNLANDLAILYNLTNYLAFNKLCAEFLKEMKYKERLMKALDRNVKYLYVVDTSNFEKPFSKELTNNINHTRLGSVTLGYCIDLANLKFHNDLYWIIELKNKIIRLGFYFIKTRTNMSICSNDNDMVICNEPINTTETTDQTVRLIGKFILWYNDNKDNGQ